MTMWLNMNDILVEPSPYQPVKYQVVGPADTINGGPFVTTRKTVPVILFTLECGHLAGTWANTAETELRCIFHDKPSKIVGVHVFEWRAKCFHVGSARCPFSRWAATSKAIAADHANKHARTHPSHAPFVGLEYCLRPDAQAELEKRTANGQFEMVSGR
jgi:hypothetical protein